MSHTLAITDADFKNQVEQSTLPVLVDLWADWCGPCKMIGPIVEEIAAENKGKLYVFKMNVDENPETPGRFGIMGIPTLLLFKGGQLVETLVGYMPKDRLMAKIRPHLP
jgi:thioredoxin 1